MNTNEQDAEWVLRTEQQDEHALEAVVRHYTGYVMTIIRKMAVPPLSEEDAEELTSDVFVLFWKKAHTLRDPFALKAFLAQIARHTAIDRLRRHNLYLPLEEDRLIVERHTPESISDLHEQTDIIAATLRSMDPTRRACMVYRYYYGEELAVIAKRLALPLSTVKSHIYRGRRQLIDTLHEKGYSYEEGNNISSFV